MAAIAPIADMEDQPIADGAVQPVEHKPPEKLSDKDKPIPLLCTICPKKPKFSDTSHLLTHLNSKGHLANCQQVDLRAQSDPAYRQIKNGYDAWYSENNLLSLLTERQVAKDQKDAKKDASKRKRSRESNLKKSKKPLQLPQPDIKPDPDRELLIAPDAHFSGSFLHHERQGYLDNGYQTPVRLHGSGYTFPDSRESSVMFKQSSSRAESVFGPDIIQDAAQEEPAESDSSKLKGIIFPGMGLFDAATPEQKRRRNQRKDGSVLEQMKVASASVLPNESVWSGDIEFERIRDIYASPSIEGSPEPDKGKKKRQRKAVALDELSANVPIKKEGNGDKRVARQPGYLTRSAVQKAATAGTGSPEDGSAGRVNSNHSFDVFRDEDMTSSRANSSGSSVENRFEFRNRPISLQSMTQNAMSSFASPSRIAKQAGFSHFGGKENCHLSFQPSTLVDGFYDGSQMPEAGGVNPLLQSRDYSFHGLGGMSNSIGNGMNNHAYRPDTHNHTTAFQPINTSNANMYGQLLVRTRSQVQYPQGQPETEPTFPGNM